MRVGRPEQLVLLSGPGLSLLPEKEDFSLRLSEYVENEHSVVFTVIPTMCLLTLLINRAQFC